MTKEEIVGDRIFVIRGFLSPAECAEHIARSEAVGYTDAPITTGHGPVMRKDIRDNARVMVDDVPLAAALFDRARPFLPEQYSVWNLVGLNERFRYYRYTVGQTFRPHLDGSFNRTNQEVSQLTFMVYLNQDFTGGATIFYGTPQVAITPETGMALVFVHQQLHEGAPVESGVKYVLRTDVMYRCPS